MNERLTVKSFGPVKDLDITFKKITLFIGDQGTGKSCVAKLFSIFKWLEKDLIMKRNKPNYYSNGDVFKNTLCAYHGLDSFFRNDTAISFNGESYDFAFSNGLFEVVEKKDGRIVLPKIMYVPAERSILSVAENKPILRNLPPSCATFNEEFMGAKEAFKTGYALPFGDLHFKYDSLNSTSKIWEAHDEKNPVLLRHASSGVQAALPLCLVTEYLSRKVAEGDDLKLAHKEIQRIDKEIAAIMENKSLSKIVRDRMLKKLSDASRYGSFINIAEEPELNLFPKSQLEVLSALVRCNASTSDNMLVLTTHSPYTLAIFNTMIMAAKVYAKCDETAKKNVAKIVPRECHISPDDILAFRLSSEEGACCNSIASELTGMISKNDLDGASEDIKKMFNSLYRLYVKADS